MNIFNFFKHKEKEESKTYEGRFVSEDEIFEMTLGRKSDESFISKEMNEIKDMMKKLNQITEE